MSRGLENRNPGNIRRAPVRYKGEVRPSRDPDFKEFESLAWGYRAIFVLLDTYRARYGIDTLRGMISRWAPPSENRTEAYIRAVADDTGLDPDPNKGCPGFPNVRSSPTNEGHPPSPEHSHPLSPSL